MGVSGQRHAPAALYPRGKKPRYPLDRRLGGPQSRSGARRKILCPYRRSNLDLPIVQPVVRHNIAWATARFQTKMLTAFLSCPMRATCPADLVQTVGLCIAIPYALQLCCRRSAETDTGLHQLTQCDIHYFVCITTCYSGVCHTGRFFLQWHVLLRRVARSARNLLVGKPEGMSPLGRPKRRWI
jgi:hypothetical protein